MQKYKKHIYKKVKNHIIKYKNSLNFITASELSFVLGINSELTEEVLQVLKQEKLLKQLNEKYLIK
ncbi:MAG: hypothetical protein ACOCRK_02690 [bacterium]